jgi:hypothetical protein
MKVRGDGEQSGARTHSSDRVHPLKPVGRMKCTTQRRIAEVRRT